MTTQMTRIDPTEELLSTLKGADSVLLFGHIAPDGDALGSVLALALLLRDMGKKVEMGVDGIIPGQLMFLPSIGDFHMPGQLTADENTLAVAVDVGDLGRLGGHQEVFLSAGKKMVIDHHGTNTHFGDVNWVDGHAPASAVMIWRLMKALGHKMTKDQALCLYTGLSTDTGNFIYESVNDECFSMMAELMDAGLELAQYSRILFRQKRVNFVRLLSETLPTLRILGDGSVAGLSTAYEVFTKNNLPESETDGVVDYAIDLEGVVMAYYAHEKQSGDVKFSLRALPPYRVDKLAVQFGGGGHAQAAGCTLPGPVGEAVSRMEAAILQSKQEQDDQA